MKRLSTFLLSVIFLCSFTVWTARADSGVVRFTVRNNAPIMKALPDGQTSVLESGAGQSGLPGQPLLPYKVVRLAIPPEADAKTVRVEVTARQEAVLPGRFQVIPAPPFRPLNNGPLSWGPHAARVVNGYDTEIYGMDRLFPISRANVSSSIGELRRYRYKTVTLYPVRVNPSDGTLFQVKQFDIAIHFDTAKHRVGTTSGDCGRDQFAEQFLDNYDQARAWYPPQCLTGPDGSKGVAIITTNDIEWNSTLLEDYVEMRNGQGFDVNVYTEVDWDIPTGATMDDRADRIRNWLKQNYESLDLGYVFLMGNPDPAGHFRNSIPMKYCGMHEDPQMGKIQAPTDFYYADLTGTWDTNDDGTTCEFGVDEVDFAPELYVGRLPIYSDGAPAIDEMLARIMDYEQESLSGDIAWRRRMMLPNSIYFYEMQAGSNGTRWDGASTGEWFIRDELKPRGMKWTSLYETEGISPSVFDSHLPINTENVVDQWVRGYGLVFWMGHGSNTGVYRAIWEADDDGDEMPGYGEVHSPEFMSSGRLHMLTESPPPFVVHGSCSNGTPEDASNLGYAMLRRGAIATLSASRVALAWHVPDFETEYWEKLDVWDGCVVDLVADYAVNILDGMEAGRAIGETIAATSNIAEETSWYQKSIQNLYGDPLVRLVMCREDADCDNHVLCDGEELCVQGSCTPGEPIVCEPEGDCGDMICKENIGCVPSDTCEESSTDADSDADTDADTDTDSDTDTDTDTDADTDSDTDSDPGMDEEPDPEDLSAKSSCTAAPARPARPALFGLIASIF